MALNNIKNLRSESGFTLVELLIVIVVIAILAAISIVSYTGIQNRGKETSARSLASQVAKKADIYYTIHGEYPESASDFTGGESDYDLDGAGVTFVSTAPADYNAAITAVGTNDDAFKSGNHVIYQGDAGDVGGAAGGYIIWHWVAGNNFETVEKGTVTP